MSEQELWDKNYEEAKRIASQGTWGTMNQCTWGEIAWDDEEDEDDDWD